MKKGLKILGKVLGTLAVMAVCCIVAFTSALTFLMNLGSKYHDNYEYYGSFPAVLFLFFCGGVGFITPGLLFWWLEKNNWRFGLRALLIIITVIAALLGAYTLSL